MQGTNWRIPEWKRDPAGFRLPRVWRSSVSEHLKDEGLAAINYFMYSGVNIKLTDLRKNTFPLRLTIVPDWSDETEAAPAVVAAAPTPAAAAAAAAPAKAAVSGKLKDHDHRIEFSILRFYMYWVFYVTLYPWQKRDACLETSL